AGSTEASGSGSASASPTWKVASGLCLRATATLTTAGSTPKSCGQGPTGCRGAQQPPSATAHVEEGARWWQWGGEVEDDAVDAGEEAALQPRVVIGTGPALEALYVLRLVGRARLGRRGHGSASFAVGRDTTDVQGIRWESAHGWRHRP